ncbi:hypothetical protein ACHAXR_005604 [Thalassiosira sp. AJA248-18]
MASKAKATASAVAAATASSKYGALWGRGYETFLNRRILSVTGTGDHATTYLQGLVTSDLTSEPRAPREEIMENVHALSGVSVGEGSAGGVSEAEEPAEEEVPVRFTSKMRSTCFLDHRGRILTDAILWKRTLDNDNAAKKQTTEYLIDVPGDTADLLYAHLKQHKLRRSKIKLVDKSEDLSVHAVYGTLNAEGAPPGYIAAMDPRHPSLGMRVLSVGDEIVNPSDVTESDSTGDGDDGTTTAPTLPRNKRQQHFETLMNNFFSATPGTYSVLRKLSGIAEGSEITSKTALECNQEFLNAISFTKGCYLGQELTARSQFKGVVRKRIVPIMIADTEIEVPKPWIMAAMMQELGEEGAMEKVFGLTGDKDGLEKKKLELKGHIPPPLPKMSAAGAGSIVSMMMGSIALSSPPKEAGGNPQEGGAEEIDESHSKEEELEIQQAEEELKRLQQSGTKLQSELTELAIPGASIIDKKDGKPIGKIVSTPAPGTTVLLAQMRLDRLGLLGSANQWSRTNKILIGDNSTKEYRYLPYLPLWWPEIDSDTGKEKIAEEEEEEDDGEEELDEL